MFSTWTDISNRISELQEKRQAAIRNGNLEFHRFDSKIRKAKEAEAEAEQAYHAHMDQHGCGADLKSKAAGKKGE